MLITIGPLPQQGWRDPAERIVDLARLCEEVGVDRFAIEDNRRRHDCFVLMTACLQATRSLVVESLVTDPYVRAAHLTARMAGTIADLSGGRLILGIGGGLEQPAYDGASRAHPLQAVRETVDICRRLWRGETVTLEGQVMRTLGLALDFNAPPIPVLIAARGKGMLRLAGEIADITLAGGIFLDLEYLRECAALVAEGAQRAGRDLASVEIDMTVPLCISRDRAKARRAVRRTAAQGILWMTAAEEYSRGRKDWKRPSRLDVPAELVAALSTWDMWNQSDLPDELAALITDEILDKFAVAGDPDECAERLRDLAAKVPPAITGMRLKLPPPVDTTFYEQSRETIQLLGTVLPRIRSASERIPSGSATR